MIGRTLGLYQVVAKLGEGGMGEVYRATDTNLKRDVAIKVLPEAVAADRERLARFQREAEVLAALNHPNIAAVYGLERTDGQTAMVMELVDGPTLADRIARGPIPIDEALPIAKQIAEALEAAHDQGIVHRDLKPANIKVRDDGTVKVLDFGLAKAIEPAGAAGSSSLSQSPTMTTPAMTQFGMILGTAVYMSPEQARGRPVDRRADIWAFGCVLYEMVTGRRVFQGEDVTEVLASVVKGQPDIAAAPASLRKLLARCLEKDPRRRLRHIGDAWDLVDEAAERTATTTRPRTSTLSWVVSGLGLVAAVAFGMLWLLRDPASPAELVRLALLPPENASLVNAPPAVSPDGRAIAFVARAGGGNQVYIRRLAEPDAHAVPGTEGALFAFWSPDGSSLGFTTRNGFKRIDLAGGPARVLYPGEHGSTNGTWNEAGDILFYPVPIIARISASGGTATPVTELDAGLGETSHRFPQFLPDGKRFLFYVFKADGTRAIALGTLGSLVHKTILESESAAVYAPAPGQGAYLLFRRGSTLMAQRFDENAEALVGDPFVVADGVGGAGGGGTVPAVSVSPNGLLAYTPEAVGRQRVLAWFDRQGNRLGPLLPEGARQAPRPDAPIQMVNDGRNLPVGLHIRMSSDGKRVAFDGIGEAGGLSSVWVADLDSRQVSRVTFGQGEDTPVWSADGDSLCYRASTGSTDEIRVKKLGGTERVLFSGQRVRPLDWSPDNRFVAVSHSGSVKLLPLDKDGSQLPVPIDLGMGRIGSRLGTQQARFSPDGTYLALVVALPGAESEVHVVPMPPATGDWTIAKGAQPVWRRDGQELFYLRPDLTLMSVEVSYAASLQLGLAQPLFVAGIDSLEAISSGSYDASSDGQQFLIRVPEETSRSPLTVMTNWWAVLRD